jgi:hypothetical protein
MQPQHSFLFLFHFSSSSISISLYLPSHAERKITLQGTLLVAYFHFNIFSNTSLTQVIFFFYNILKGKMSRPVKLLTEIHSRTELWKIDVKVKDIWNVYNDGKQSFEVLVVDAKV